MPPNSLRSGPAAIARLASASALALILLTNNTVFQVRKDISNPSHNAPIQTFQTKSGSTVQQKGSIDKNGVLRLSGAVISGGVTLGTGTYLTQSSADTRYVNTSGDTMTGALGIRSGNGAMAVDAGVLLEIGGTMSGRTIHAQDVLRSSGSLLVDGTTAFNNISYTWPSSKGSCGVGSGCTLTLTGTSVDTLKWARPFSVDVQIFTTTGANTWTKPTGAKWVEVILIGGGGGGGSGRKGAAGSERYGGGGGQGGGYTRATIPASTLGSTVTVSVGSGGIGGAAQATNSTDGNDGSPGGDTSFGSHAIAQGGGEGAGGGNGGGGEGGGPDGEVSSKYGLGTVKGASGGSGQNGFQTGRPSSITSTNDIYDYVPVVPGGGGGGGVEAGNTALDGGEGGKGSLLKDLVGITGGTAGVASTSAGGNGTAATANTPYSGSAGGGGGGRHAGGNAFAGGNGGLYGAGGGGGGASTNDVGNSGAGGDGADGIAIVTTYF